MEHQLYIQGIKTALKTHKLTYEDLAQHMKMSESGIKKMLTAKDISFRRILQICDCLDILPGTLLTMTEKTSIAEVQLTNTQENALLDNKYLLMVFWCVAIERRSIREIEKKQKISNQDLKKLLNRLVTLDLLVEKKGAYKARHRGKFRWADHSKLAKQLNHDWSLLTLRKSLEQKRTSKSLQRLITMKMSQNSYDQLVQKMNDVFNEAVHISERDEIQIQNQDLHNVSAVIAMTDSGIFDE